MESLRRQVRRFFGVALTSLWLVTVAAAAAASPAMHCQGMHMSCCPRSGSDGAQCVPVQCDSQAFQKSEARTLPRTSVLSRAAAPSEIVQPSLRNVLMSAAVPLDRSDVFRWKDDLRI
jgi:hypothetical protein